MTDHHFNNDADQAERKAIVANDSNFVRQQNELDTSGGRFAKVTPTKLVGADHAYPAPPTGPWSGADPAPPEEPLGYSVDDMEK